MREANATAVVRVVGMTVQEAADVLGVCADTAKDYSAYARAWLYRELTRKSN